MPLSERVGPQASAALAGQAVNALATLALVAVVARSIGSTGLGMYLIAISVSTVVTLITTFAATIGLVRMLSKYRTLGQSDWLVPTVLAAGVPTLLSSVVASMLLYTSSSTVAAWYTTDRHAVEAETYLRLAVIAIPLWATATVLLCALRGIGAIFPYVACENVGRPLLQLLLTVLVLSKSARPSAITAAWVAPFALELGVIILWFIIDWRRRVGHLRMNVPGRDVRRAVRDYWAYTMPQAVGGTVQILAQRLDVLLVGVLSTTAAAGEYGAASRYIAGAGMILGPITVAIGPRLSEFFASSRTAAAARLYQHATAAVCFFALPPYVVLALFAPLAMAVFGHELASAAPALAVLATATVISLVAGPVLIALALAGDTRASGIITGLAALTGVCLDFILVPRYGALGAALGYFIGLTLANVWPLLLVWRRYGIHPFGPETVLLLLTTVASIGPFAVIARATPTSSQVWPLACLVASIVTYCYLLWCRRGSFALMLRESFPGRHFAGRGAAL